MTPLLAHPNLPDEAIEHPSHTIVLPPLKDTGRSWSVCQNRPGQTHYLATFDINGRDKYHNSPKFFKTCSPAFWLFSGWNCTPRYCHGQPRKQNRSVMSDAGGNGSIFSLYKIRMAKIHIFTGWKTSEHLITGRLDLDLVPAHVRDLQLGEALNTAFQNSKPSETRLQNFFQITIAGLNKSQKWFAVLDNFTDRAG